MKQVHKVTLLCVDHDFLGPEGTKREIEAANWPNDCLHPTVMALETAQVDWTDDHPLNITTTMRSAYEALFQPKPETFPMVDLNPPQRLWECSWLILDLERIEGIRRYSTETKVFMFADPRGYSFDTTNPEKAAEEADLIKAWKAYRAAYPRERL